MADTRIRVRLKQQVLLISVMFVSAAGLVAILVWMAVLAFPASLHASQEAVRVRNALIAQVGRNEDFDWTPDATPKDFLAEKAEVPGAFRAIVSGLEPANQKLRLSSFERMVRVASQLKANGESTGPASTNIVDAYQLITKEGRGWCSDFTQVMLGIAYALGIPSREWGIAFDGFGGDGHAINEIYDDKLKKWILLDAYFSIFARDRLTQTPLSVREFQAALRDQKRLQQVELVRFARNGTFKSPENAIKYYQQGADQFYLLWGNNVFSYEGHPLVATLAHVSRSFAQASGILLGVYPRIRIAPTDANREMIGELVVLRSVFLGLLALGLLLTSVLVLGGCRFMRRRGRQPDSGLETLSPFPSS